MNNPQELLQNFYKLLSKLHQIRGQSSGKTLTQDLVRVFMFGLPEIYPLVSVRVYFNNWHYEHFPKKRITLPSLAVDSNQLARHVFQQKQPFLYHKENANTTYFKELDSYLKQGIVQIQMIPLVDVNQMPLGFVEVASDVIEISDFSKDLLHQLVHQLEVFLETSLGSVRRQDNMARQSSPELLGRLKQYEDEIRQLSERLQESVKYAQEREGVFYSLIHYFRDSVRMIDAWNHLKSMATEGSLNQYDFQRHTDFYLEQTFRFSELLLHIHKLQRGTLKPQLEELLLQSCVHDGIAGFTTRHPEAPLNLKVALPRHPVAVLADSLLFETAITYVLEHLFTLVATQDINVVFAVEGDVENNHIILRIGFDLDPLIQQIHEDPLDFDTFMRQPLDNYGLSMLYMPFVHLALQVQDGQCQVNQNSTEQMCVTISIPRGKTPINSTPALDGSSHDS
ncbi:MAG: hypothetical protein HQM12_10860 [SAR324 cluster bacterium]|nr:hypothetical protein [SAR324 cluster bacterium]